VRDGTEAGVVADDLGPDTDVAAGNFVPDADPTTTTSAVNPDTDGGGLGDGFEDSNFNGAVDDGETDPNDPTDDDVNSDQDGDGILDTDEGVVDADGDGIPNFLDLDSDGDSIADADEAGDGDLATPPVDSDGDGTPDYLDLDSDDDNISDADEAGDDDIATSPVDTDDDGTPDYLDLDSDADGLTDEAEAGDDDLATPPVDTDGDGDPDFQDTDSDNDGVVDGEDNCRLVENADQADVDGDGVGDLCTQDADGDGWADDLDNCPNQSNRDQADADADDLGDVCDADRDGNGFDDDIGVQGGGCQASNGGGAGGVLVLAVFLGGVLARRRRRVAGRAGRAAGATMVLAAAAGPAAAQVVDEPGDFPVERFRWTGSRTGILGAESGGVAATGSWDAGLWLGTADDPLVLYRETDGERTRVGPLVAQRTSATLVASYALWRRLELGIEVPLVLAQSRGDSLSGVNGELASIDGVSIGDLRFVPKFALLTRPRFGLQVALTPAVTVPSGGKTEYRGENGVTFAPELDVSGRWGRFQSALNVGYRLRPSASLLNLAVDDEVFGIAAIGARVHRAVNANLGLSAATAARHASGHANQTHLEALAGADWDVTPHLRTSLIGGLGLNEGFGTPDWRLVLGVRWGTLREAAGPTDLDGDGLYDDVDACPREAEDADQFRDDDGCLDPDNDGDGVLDGADGAPLDPEDVDGFADTDGVPDPDNDGDGVSDGDDGCPLVAGAADNRGCPDADGDGDGVVDRFDGCPQVAEDVDTFEDLDGCPDLDNDGDTVADVADRCPLVAGPVENGGCPDTDGDGDGVVDRLDNCPVEVGDAKNQGCAKKQMVVLTGTTLQTLDIVYFELDRDVIKPKSFDLLDNVAKVLGAHLEITSIEVQGHTDNQGNDAYNKDLSQRRAAQVVEYLVKRGIDRARLTPVGYGETQPVKDNGTKAGRAANRRVDFIITGANGVAVTRSGPTADTLER
jgi:outer membrane protein OmpA-like peptidoglycan-associated protein